MSRWIPLESNPEVLNSWATKAGLVPSQAHFVDVYGLDPELLAMLPQPVKALLLLFPISDALESQRKGEEEKIAKEGQPLVDPTIFWIKQTISNACGTIGLLHALVNSDVTFAPESPITKFIDECVDKTPEERAKILESTPLFANIHAEAASSGQTAVPRDLDTNLHFTCFVQAPTALRRTTQNTDTSMRLIELDGRRAGPVDRGECTDLVKDVAAIVKKQYMSQSSSLNFSMTALIGQKP